MDQGRHQIDQRELDRLLKFCERRKLFEHRADLKLRLASFDPTSNSSFDYALYDAWRADVLAFEQFHTHYPPRVAPPGALAGRDLFFGLRQVADDQEITLDLHTEGSHSGLLAGPTGTGKSTVQYHLARGARARGAHVWIISPKAEAFFRELAAHDTDFLVLTPTTELNLIRPDGSLRLPDHISVGVDASAESLYGGQDNRQVNTIGFTRAHEADHEATLHDVVREISRLESRGETYKFRDALRGAKLRHQRTIDRYPGWHTKGAPGLDALFDHSLYLPLTQITETEDFLIAYLLRRLFHYNQRGEICTS